MAGAIGPMNKTLSLSPDVNNPGFRSISFDEVAEAYYEQVKALVEGGVDLLLIETIFDTLNAKAAIYAVKKYFRDQNREELPLMISGTMVSAIKFTVESRGSLSERSMPLTQKITEYIVLLVLAIGFTCLTRGKTFVILARVN